MTYHFFNPTPTTCEALKAAYRKLATKHHPDLGGNLEARDEIYSICKETKDDIDDIWTQNKDRDYMLNKLEAEAKRENAIVRLRDILNKVSADTLKCIIMYCSVDKKTGEKFAQYPVAKDFHEIGRPTMGLMYAANPEKIISAFMPGISSDLNLKNA